MTKVIILLITKGSLSLKLKSIGFLNYYFEDNKNIVYG